MAADIERAAATMLAHATIAHPEVRAWARRITSELDYTDPFRFSDNPRRLYNEMYGADGADLYAALDRAAIRLGTSICQYRADGRPEGDVDYEIPLAGVRISSSLAADVASFVEEVTEAWARHALDLGTELKLLRRHFGVAADEDGEEE